MHGRKNHPQHIGVEHHRNPSRARQVSEKLRVPAPGNPGGGERFLVDRSGRDRGNPLTAPAYRPFFAEANRMKLCILLHPMLPANSEPFREYVLGPIIGFPFDPTLAVARMCYDGLLRDFPDIRWIIAHIGGAVPYLMERMDNGFRDFADCRVKIDKLPSVYLKRLYYDTVSFSPHTLTMVGNMLGVDHMVMGSDYPHLLGSIDRAVTSIEELDISGEEKQQIFSGTSLKILNNV